MSSGSVPFALALSLLAGLSTLIGCAFAISVPRSSGRGLSSALAFAGGAMLYISFVEIVPRARASLSDLHGDAAGWLALVGFFAGIFAAFFLDRLLPLHLGAAEGTRAGDPGAPQLARVGLFTAAAVGLHNFPEGIASFVGALEPGPERFLLPFAIALHNLPEGVAIAAPILLATQSRSKAVWVTLLASLAEPLGALAASTMLAWLLATSALGLIFASLAGVMVYIAIDELLPAARQHGGDASTTFGFVAGMAVLSASLELLR